MPANGNGYALVKVFAGVMLTTIGILITVAGCAWSAAEGARAEAAAARTEAAAARDEADGARDKADGARDEAAGAASDIRTLNTAFQAHYARQEVRHEHIKEDMTEIRKHLEKIEQKLEKQ